MLNLLHCTRFNSGLKCPRLVSLVILSLAITSVMTMAGCKKNSVRKDVWGTISWKGQPIPNGFINFIPDQSKGNKGPAAIAMIKDGKFDTRFENSRGCVAGPNIAIIHAYDGKGIQRMIPYGQPMFDGEVQLAKPIEVLESGGEFDLIVPESVKPVGKSKKFTIE